jgi:hypothetical protein
MRGTVSTGLVMAGWLVAAALPAAAQRGETESAAQNVRESQIYDQLVCANPSFREQRMRIECGPITDPQLHQSCLASFNCGPGAPTGKDFRGTPSSQRVR